MHSRIFVLRQVEEGKKLPSISNCNCVTEDELSDSFVPHHADYVSLEREEEDWNYDIKWLVDCYSDMFTIIKENNETFLVLDTDKVSNYLVEMFNKFKEVSSKITENDFCSPYSMNMYELQMIINDETGFWIINIDEQSGWYYETFDSFLRNCYIEKETSKTIKFRVEDIFDYHF